MVVSGGKKMVILTSHPLTHIHGHQPHVRGLGRALAHRVSMSTPGKEPGRPGEGEAQR